MNTWNRINVASRAAATEFRRVYSNPSQAMREDEQKERMAQYDYLWSYYMNNAFEDLGAWSRYKSDNRLYRWTRSIYNPYQRLVDFYAGTVYPGVLVRDPEQELPNGVQNAIPLNEGIKPELAAAIYQFYNWSNWQSNKNLLVRKTAALGSQLVELVDDMERGKVYPDFVWPGWVTALELDSGGNVKEYTLEYRTLDDDDKEYTYKKEVDGDSFRYYRDDSLEAEDANPYGFVPACWFKHRDLGGSVGFPAMRNINKMDELNSLATHAVDNLHKLFSAPIIVGGSGNFLPLAAGGNNPSGSTSEQTPAEQGQQSLDVLTGPADATMLNMDVPAEEAIPHMEKMIGEIEADHPELTFYAKLREVSQLTGPAAARLSGDVQAYVTDAQSSYDQQTQKLMQMQIAISGWRLGDGAWGQNGAITRQQQAFAGFDLDSYARGDLEFQIMPRPLVPITAMEQAELDRAQQSLENDRQAIGVTDALSRIQSRIAGGEQ